MKRVLFIASLTMLLSSQLQAQSLGKDSRGKDIFNFYATKAVTTNISSTATSLTVGYNIPIKSYADDKGIHGIQYYVGDYYKLLYPLPYNGNVDYLVKKGLIDSCIVEVDSSHFTVAYSQSLNISVTGGNLGSDFANLSAFHPSFGASIGFSENIDQFNNWDMIKTLAAKELLSVWSVTGYFNVDNLLLYDTTSKVQPRKHPLTYGVTGEFSIFPHNARWYCASASLNLERGKDLSKLQKFQVNTPTYSDENVVALGDIVGKIGDVPVANNVRLRLSLPIFIDGFKSPAQLDSDRFLNKISHMSLIPYFTIFGSEGSHFSKSIGGFVNILGKAFGYKNSTIVPGGGFGIDWIHSPQGWSHRHIFVAGSFNIPSFFKHTANNKPS